MLKDIYTHLLSDPSRQAGPMFTGCDYQVWQSLLAWINLNPQELLYLEGAEDIDAYGPNGVTVTQVKHSARNITLRSPDIIDAINNFWSLKSQNPDQRIQFCFLTIAEPTKEKGSPFGTKCGLDLWAECKNVTVDCKPLQEFLAAQNGLKAELKEALRTWTPDEFRRELLFPITWATGSPPFEHTQQQVEDAVHRYGMRKGLNRDQSVKLIPELLEEVRKVIRRKADRYLDKQEFRDAFQKSARITVPLAGFNALMEMAGLALPSGIDTGVDLEIGSPPLPQPLISRHNLIHQLSLELIKNRILVITGSSGVGKTITANQMIVDQEWAWLSLRNASPTKISRLLKYSLNRFDFGGSVLGVVLDDLDCRQGITEIEPNLMRFLNALLSCDCRIIVTSTTNLPSRIQMLFQDRGISLGRSPIFKQARSGTFCQGAVLRNRINWNRGLAS